MDGFLSQKESPFSFRIDLPPLFYPPTSLPLRWIKRKRQTSDSRSCSVLTPEQNSTSASLMGFFFSRNFFRHSVTGVNQPISSFGHVFGLALPLEHERPLVSSWHLIFVELEHGALQTRSPQSAGSSGQGDIRLWPGATKTLTSRTEAMRQILLVMLLQN